MQKLIASLVGKWGLAVKWERANHCPYVSQKGQKCSERPVAQCPICGGIGITFDPPLTTNGIFSNREVRVTVHGHGQTLESTPTLLLSPVTDEETAMLDEGVFRTFPDKVELKDRFTVRGVLYVADGPATPPTLADQQLAWRIPLKRVMHKSRGGA